MQKSEIDNHKNTPLLSVLVTFYNQEECVDCALKSILNQDFRGRLEILVGDDGSTDGTTERIREWKEKYPEIIRYFFWNRVDGLKTINRASRNRSSLLREAKGDYLVFLDGDDFFVGNQKFCSQLTYLENHPSVSSCAHRTAFVDARGKVLSFAPAEKVQSGIMSNKRYWSGRYCTAMSFMFRNYYKDGLPQGFNEAYFDDNTIAFWFIDRGPIFYSSEVMAHYVQNDGSLWNSLHNDERLLVDFEDYLFEISTGLQLSRSSYRRHIDAVKKYERADLNYLSSLGFDAVGIKERYPFAYAFFEKPLSEKPSRFRSGWRWFWTRLQLKCMRGIGLI